MYIVAAVSKQNTKEQASMHLLRRLRFFVAYFDIDLKCKRTAGVNNTTADYLSRNNLHSFLSLHPQAVQQPTPIPLSLFQRLEVGAPDWSSLPFRQQFSILTRMVYSYSHTKMLQSELTRTSIKVFGNLRTYSPQLPCSIPTTPYPR